VILYHCVLFLVAVTDRLAFFNFVSGSLASALSKRLDDARVPMKTLRDAGNALAARHSIRAAYEREISKLETDRPRGHEKRLAEVEQLLRRAEIEDDPLEKEVEILSRTAVRESEQAKWDAIREVSLFFSCLLKKKKKTQHHCPLPRLVWRETCPSCSSFESCHRCIASDSSECEQSIRWCTENRSC
jgi:Eisosome component PIL1